MKIEKKFIGTITLKFTNADEMEDVYNTLQDAKSGRKPMVCNSKILLIKSIVDMVKDNENFGRKTSLTDIKTAIDKYIF